MKSMSTHVAAAVALLLLSNAAFATGKLKISGAAAVAGNTIAPNKTAIEHSSKVLSSAQSLSSESTHLKAEVEKFLSTVRAA
jgi:hypothetical protein